MKNAFEQWLEDHNFDNSCVRCDEFHRPDLFVSDILEEYEKSINNPKPKTFKKDFTLYFYEKEMELLKKFNFNEEINEFNFTKNEIGTVRDLKEKGILSSFVVDGKTYFQGTGIYKQLNLQK